jgi:hypothetical protein
MQSVNLSSPRGSHFDGNYLYVSVQRRAEQGLQLQGSYTYGKLMNLPIYTDIGTTQGVTVSNPQNWRNLDGDYAVDQIDVTHRGTIAALYDLPFGRGRRYLATSALFDRILGARRLRSTPPSPPSDIGSPL